MNAFEPAPLTTAGLIVMRDEEVDLKAETEGITIYSQKGKTKQSELFTGSARGRCQVSLTNLRILVIVPASNGNRIGWGINLKNVVEVEDCAVNIFVRSTRIRVHVRKYSAESGANIDVDIGIGFEREGILGDIGLMESRKDEFLELLRRALMRKSWLAIEEANKERRLAESMASLDGKLPRPDGVDIGQIRGAAVGVGIGGLMKRQEKDMSEAERLTKEATGDLNSLMERAREVVKIVEKFAKIAENHTKTYEDNDNDDETGFDGNYIDRNADDDTDSVVTSTSTTYEMESILQSIGMVSPVTKYSAGRMYHRELARQVADLLTSQSRLDRMGGMITLPDLYCILNRARGTELVSPDDLYRATRLMGHLNVGMHLANFPSGVKMIRSDTFSNEAVFERILALFKDTDPTRKKSTTECKLAESNGLLFNDVAASLGLSITVAKEQVLMAEQHGLLCRDESIRGVAFFSISYFL